MLIYLLTPNLLKEFDFPGLEKPRFKKSAQLVLLFFFCFFLRGGLSEGFKLVNLIFMGNNKVAIIGLTIKNKYSSNTSPPFFVGGILQFYIVPSNYFNFLTWIHISDCGWAYSD